MAKKSAAGKKPKDVVAETEQELAKIREAKNEIARQERAAKKRKEAAEAELRLTKRLALIDGIPQELINDRERMRALVRAERPATEQSEGLCVSVKQRCSHPLLVDSLHMDNCQHDLMGDLDEWTSPRICVICGQTWNKVGGHTSDAHKACKDDKEERKRNDKQIVLLDWDGKIKRVSDIWRFTFETIRAAFRRSVEQGSNNLMWDKKKK